MRLRSDRLYVNFSSSRFLRLRVHFLRTPFEEVSGFHFTEFPLAFRTHRENFSYFPAQNKTTVNLIHGR
jgi:hypothetical protein